MSARKDKRSRPFKRLLSDPWRKLASILLALLLWYYLNSLVTTPISSRLEVRLNTPGDGINVTLPGKDYRLVRIVDGETNEPLLLDEVVLRLEGPNDKISRLERQQSWGAQMTMLEVQSNPPQPPFITFQIDDLQHATEAAEFDPLLVSMTPRTVRLELSKNADEDVLLSMDNLDVKFGDSDIDRLDLEDPRFPTPSVTVFGSENLMRSIAVQRIFDVDLRDVSIEDEPTLTVALKLKPTFADQGIELDPEALFVEFKVNPPWSDIYDLEVPVVVDEQMLAEGDRGNFVPESAAVPVKIRIAGTLLQDLLAEQIYLLLCLG